MKSQVQKWGNSLALRIPKGVAEELGLRQNATIELQVHNGQLVVTPVRRTYDLSVLLSAVTDDNRHAETDWGEAQGREEW